MILKREFWSLHADGQGVRREMFLFELSDNARVNRLRLGRNVLGDQFFALGKDLAKWTRVGARSCFFKRSPFHKVRYLLRSLLRDAGMSQLIDLLKMFLDVVDLVPVSHNRDFRLCRIDAYKEASAYREPFLKLRAYTAE